MPLYMQKTHGITDLVTGVCETDFSGYPDCRDIFVKSLNVTVNLAMDYNFCYPHTAYVAEQG